MSERKPDRKQTPLPGWNPRSAAGMTRRSALALPLAAAAVFAGASLSACQGGGRGGKSFQVNGGMPGPVLNPARFSRSSVRHAYAMAAKYRQVVDKLYCYCNCSRPPFLHKSLLSCYVGTHAAG